MSMRIVSTNITASTSPGRTPAISKAPTSIRASDPSSTASEDGGMIIARDPVARIGPMTSAFLYPRLRISGIKVVPSIAVLAIEDPDSVAKSVPPATVI